MAGTSANEQDEENLMYHKQYILKLTDNNPTSNDQEHPQLVGHDRDSQFSESNSPPQNIGRAPNPIREFLPSRFLPPIRQRGTQTFADSLRVASTDVRFESSQLISSESEASLDLEDLIIPWSDLVLRERIGAGFP